MLAPGTVLAGRYEVLRQLGAGGMGDIYEAHQRDLSRRVAIKTLQGDLASDPESFARFRREAEAAAALGHPNIVQVLDFVSAPGEPAFIVMEMLDGRTLHQAMWEDGPMPPQRACFITRQILSALAAAHAAQIVHRDVKPANIFLVKTLALPDFVKVLDFGIARVESAPGRAITQLGDVLGTTAYMAPEQARGEKVDYRADIYAVAAVLFHMLAGIPPRELGAHDIQAAARMPCKRLRDVRPTIETGLAAVVDMALSLDPKVRPTAEKLAGALEPFAGGFQGGAGSFDETIKDAPGKVPVTQQVPARPVPGPAPSNPQVNQVATSYLPPAHAPAPVYAAPVPLPSYPRAQVPTVRRRSGPGPWVFVVPLFLVLVAVGLGLVYMLGGRTRERRSEIARTLARPCRAPATCGSPKLDPQIRVCVNRTEPYAVGEGVWFQLPASGIEMIGRVTSVDPATGTVGVKDNVDQFYTVERKDILGSPCP